MRTLIDWLKTLNNLIAFFIEMFLRDGLHLWFHRSKMLEVDVATPRPSLREGGFAVLADEWTRLGMDALVSDEVWFFSENFGAASHLTKIICPHSIRTLVQSPESPAHLSINIVWAASLHSHLVGWGILATSSKILFHGHILSYLVLAFLSWAIYRLLNARNESGNLALRPKIYGIITVLSFGVYTVVLVVECCPKVFLCLHR